MRKGIITLKEKSEKQHFPKEWIDIIISDHHTVKEAEYAFRFFSLRKNMTKEDGLRQWAEFGKYKKLGLLVSLTLVSCTRYENAHCFLRYIQTLACKDIIAFHKEEVGKDLNKEDSLTVFLIQNHYEIHPCYHNRVLILTNAGISKEQILKEIYQKDKTYKKPFADFDFWHLRKNLSIKELPVNVHYQENVIEKLRNAAPEYAITINASYKKLSFNVGYNYAINIRLATYPHCLIKDKKCFPQGKAIENHLVIFPGNRFYLEKKKGGQLIPLSVSRLAVLLEEYSVFPEFEGVFETVFKQIENPFAKDIWNYIKNHNVVPSWPLNELLECHTWKEFFYKKYKKAKDVPISYNKQNPTLSYMILKALEKVEKDSEKVVLTYGFSVPEEKIEGRTLSDKIISFLVALHEEKNKGKKILEWMDYYNTIHDYISMGIRYHQKICLTKQSKAKILNEHDLMAEKTVDKLTVQLHVEKKKSKFWRLRQLLPKEFEWITSSNRLVKEGRIQHNCVASYVWHIKDDNCAVYSYISAKENTRYTIEFRQKPDGSYFIQQMHRPCNKGHTKEAYNYVTGFLEERG